MANNRDYMETQPSQEESLTQSTTSTVWFNDLSGLNLTIYYLSPYVLTRCPLNESELIRCVNAMRIHEPEQAQKIVIHGQQLNEHTDLLSQLNNLNLIPIEERLRLNARTHYVFENKDGTNVLRVTMWGQNACILVNDKAVKREIIPYKVLIPFLYGESLQIFQRIIDRALESWV